MVQKVWVQPLQKAAGESSGQRAGLMQTFEVLDTKGHCSPLWSRTGGGEANRCKQHQQTVAVCGGAVTSRLRMDELVLMSPVSQTRGNIAVPSNCQQVKRTVHT